jgi:iron complex outermembrane receptor protein
MLSLLPGPAFGDAEKADNKALTLEAVEVTAERIGDYVKNHPQNVETVQRKEIVERSLLSVEEVLKTMPGVEVAQSSGVGSRISIRGSGRSSGILVLLNGRPLNANQYGAVDLNTIPVEIIESVTVFKPPVPVWLGPGATDGAINIVTRDIAPGQLGRKARPTTIMAGGGSYGLAQGSASQVLPLAGGNVLFTGSGSHMDGKRPNSDKDDGSFSAYWNREERDGKRYEVNARYYLSEYGSPGPLDNVTPNERLRYEKGSLDTRFAGLLGEMGTYSINPYGDRVSQRDRSQSGFVANLDDVKVGVKSETTWSDKLNVWDFRISNILERDNLEHSIDGAHHRSMADLSGQYDRRFGPITTTLGLRGNYTDDFDFSPGATGGLSYALSEQTLIKGKAGYAENVPTFGQLYQTSHGSIDQVRGNPNLDKEKVWSYDVGLERRFGKDRLFQVSLFDAETHDLIISQRGADKIYRPVNIPRSERYGTELTFKYAWETGLSVEMDAIFQKSRNGDTGEDLPYTPRVKLKTTLRYALRGLKTRLEGIARYEDVQFSEAQNIMSQRINPYTVIDVRVIQPFSIKSYAGEWFLKVNNVFNTIYQSHYGYPDEGLRFETGIQTRFY